MSNVIEYEIEGQKFFVREATNDSDVVRSCRSEYVLPNMHGYEPGSYCVDVGAHLGAFSLWAAQKYFECRVIAVEPIPENQVLFTRNVEANNLQNRITLIRAAAWSTKEPTLIIPYGDESTESGRMHFFIGNPHAAQKPSIKQTVARTISLKEIMYGIPKAWCIKVDCENCEYSLFGEADPDDINRLFWVTGEFHSCKDRLDSIFDPLGFINYPHPAGNMGHFLYRNPKPFNEL